MSEDKSIVTKENDELQGHQAGQERPSLLERQKEIFSTERLEKLRLLRKSIEQIETVMESHLDALVNKLEDEQPILTRKDALAKELDSLGAELTTSEVELQAAKTDARDYTERANDVRRAIEAIDDDITKRLTVVREQVSSQLEEFRGRITKANEAYQATRKEFETFRLEYLEKKSALEHARAKVKAERAAFQEQKETLTGQVEKQEKEAIRDLARRKQTLRRDEENIDSILSTKKGVVAGKTFRVAEIQELCRKHTEALKSIETQRAVLEAEAAKESESFEIELKQILEPASSFGVASALFLDLLPRGRADVEPEGEAIPMDFKALELTRGPVPPTKDLAEETSQTFLPYDPEEPSSPEFQLDLDDLEILASMVTPVPKKFVKAPLVTPPVGAPPPVPAKPEVAEQEGAEEQVTNAAEPEKPSEEGEDTSASEEGEDISFSNGIARDSNEFDIIDVRPAIDTDTGDDDDEIRPSQRPTPVPVFDQNADADDEPRGEQAAPKEQPEERKTISSYRKFDDINQDDFYGTLFKYRLLDTEASKGSRLLVDGRELIELYGQAAGVLKELEARLEGPEASLLSWSFLLEMGGDVNDLTIQESIKTIRNITLELTSRCHTDMTRLLEQESAEGDSATEEGRQAVSVELTADDLLVLGPELSAVLTSEKGILSYVLSAEGLDAVCKGGPPPEGQLGFRDLWDVKSLSAETAKLLEQQERWKSERERSIKTIEALLERLVQE